MLLYVTSDCIQLHWHSWILILFLVPISAEVDDQYQVSNKLQSDFNSMIQPFTGESTENRGKCRTVVHLYILVPDRIETLTDWAMLFDLFAVPRLLPGTPDALRGDELYPGHIEDSAKQIALIITCSQSHAILVSFHMISIFLGSLLNCIL